MPKISQDQMMKNLLRDYPADALEFIKPEIIQRYGPPVKISFHLQEIKKHSHYDRNLTNDMAITYTFGDGKNAVILLMEHWSDKAKFDLYRFAHYFIDLANRFPGIEMLPVALFTDRSERWTKPPSQELRISCIEETYFHFKYRLIRIKDHDAAHYRDTKNRFIAVLRSAMHCEPENRIALALDCIRTYGYIERDARIIEKNIAIIEFFLEIGEAEKHTIIEKLEEKREAPMSIIVRELKRRGYNEGKKQGIQAGIKEGLQKGLKQGITQGLTQGLAQGKEQGIEQGIEQGRKNKALETARAMKEKGFDNKTIAELTGLSLAEVRKLQ